MSTPDRYGRFRFIGVTVDDGIGLVQMADPVGDDFVTARHPMHTELRDALESVARDDDIAGIVLTGHDDIFFTGPGLMPTRDLLTTDFDAGVQVQMEARDIIDRLLTFPKPTVAALNGAAGGLGCQLALLCDFVVAVPSATFRDSHIRLGLPAGDGGTLLWPLLIGLQRSRELLLRSRPLDAAEAERLGLLHAVVEPNDLLQRSADLARRLASLPSFAYRTTKLALNQWFRLGLPSFDLAIGAEIAAFSGPEFRDAIDAAMRTPERPPKEAEHDGSHSTTSGSGQTVAHGSD